ncbi:MAG: glycosyltransferase family 2 protein [Saprospiraceae bacterium]|nr:glycosyltransferase family 2 protein [Saprospiraceae bacterium]
MPDTPKVSVITVNFGPGHHTAALLENIRRLNDPRLEVWVVDNGSPENPIPDLSARFPEVHFIQSAFNRGFAGGNNLALPEATGDYLFFVNNDTEIAPGCIDKLLHLVQQKSKIGIVCPLLLHYPEEGGVLKVQYAGMTPLNPITGRNRTIGSGEPAVNWKDAEPRTTAYAHGAAMFVPRGVLASAGPMHEDYFLYYEELDWSERIRKAGYEIWVEPQAKVYHKEGATMKSMGAVKTYFLHRNRVLFMRRFQKTPALWFFFLHVLFLAAPKHTLTALFRGDWAGLRAFWKAMAWHLGAKNNTFGKIIVQRLENQRAAVSV